MTCCCVCGADADQRTCPVCVGEARDNLNTITTLAAHLPHQAVHRGVDSAAAMAAGPAADPEAWQHRALSAITGRVCRCATRGRGCPRDWPTPAPCPDEAYLSDCRDELHPLWVLGMWESDWRQVFDQPTGLRVTVGRAAAYLARQLAYAAAHHDGFDEFAADVDRCRRWLEDVLYAGARDEATAAPCFRCGGRLVRRVAARTGRSLGGREDTRRCRRCGQVYDETSYWLAVRAHAEQVAAQ
ncbi:MAG: hypothetical protein ACRDP1_02400 [Nocardioidaceae bacterium]